MADKSDYAKCDIESVRQTQQQMNGIPIAEILQFIRSKINDFQTSDADLWATIKQCAIEEGKLQCSSFKLGECNYCHRGEPAADRMVLRRVCRRFPRRRIYYRRSRPLVKRRVRFNRRPCRKTCNEPEPEPTCTDRINDNDFVSPDSHSSTQKSTVQKDNAYFYGVPQEHLCIRRVCRRYPRRICYKRRGPCRKPGRKRKPCRRSCPKPRCRKAAPCGLMLSTNNQGPLCSQCANKEEK